MNEVKLQELQERLRIARGRGRMTWDTVARVEPQLTQAQLFDLIRFEHTGVLGALDVKLIQRVVESLERVAQKIAPAGAVAFSAPPPSKHEKVLQLWREGKLREAQSLLDTIK